MGDLDQDIDLEYLQQGNEYRNRFRESIRWTTLLGVSAFLLLVFFLSLIMRPKHRTFYVSSTQGTVVRINPVNMSLFAHSQSTGGGDGKSSSKYGS